MENVYYYINSDYEVKKRIDNNSRLDEFNISCNNYYLDENHACVEAQKMLSEDLAEWVQAS